MKKYDNNWFKQRAMHSIRAIEPHVWDYADSLLLYISSGIEKYETLQENEGGYFKLVTKPEHEYFKQIAKDVVAELPAEFEYIDLGPGTERKEQFFFDEIKSQGKKFTYIPVDISEHYLQLSKKNAENQGLKVRTIQASFEELPELLGVPLVPRFVNIGLTFSNYNPQEILGLLKKVAGKNGFVFINSQIRDRIDMEALRMVYTEDASSVADEKLKLIGLDPKVDVTPRSVDTGFKVWGIVINSTQELEDLGIKPGDKLLLFQSLRYSKEKLIEEMEVSASQYKLFDTGSVFVASLLKT